MKKLLNAALLMALALPFVACTANGDKAEMNPIVPTPSEKNSSSTGDVSSSESENSSSSDSGISGDDSSLDDGFLSGSVALDTATIWNLFKDTAWVSVSSGALVYGTASFKVNDFTISKTEVTQAVYKAVMGDLPQQSNSGEAYPVENVSWYDAVLFCNAVSKLLNLDTAYVYASVGAENYLKDLTIDYSAKSIRLPTEIEWEIAARAGTSTTYYWDTDEAKKYAYYAQSKGPVKVAQHIPNALGLFDVAGNVAEWVNDWYGTYPTKSVENYTGVESGSLRVVRGGGWSDKAPALSTGERAKTPPLAKTHMLGFRVVLSEGF